jgi:hypothetical protein
MGAQLMRVRGWEILLVQLIDAAQGQEFVWGQHDCATWALDVAASITGQPSAVSWRGRYSTEIGAARHLRKLGCQTVEDLAGQLLGDPLPAVLLAQRGDLLLGGPERALGVCVGSEGRFLTEAGLIGVPLRGCAMGWRI